MLSRKLCFVVLFVCGITVCDSMHRIMHKYLSIFYQPSANDEFNESTTVAEENSDVGLTVVELVRKYGYPVEEHQNVTTDDDYLLDLHRIPHGLNNPEETNKPVVLLMHGILCSSADWVIMGPGKGLAYILADRGYDVWMGNARGNKYSRKHIIYDPDDDKENFWDFSWHEIGTKDLPAMIDYITNITGQEKIFYIGHSQGTTAFFVMLSEIPEYNNRIRQMTATAPIGYMKNCPSEFARFGSIFHFTASLLPALFDMYEFLPNSEMMKTLARKMCNDDALFQPVCSNILFLIVGFNAAQLNATTIPVILSNVPAGSSTKQFLHFLQEVDSGYFRQYDYGANKNLAVYDSTKPPSYNLSRITVPLAFYYGEKDKFTSMVDVARLENELPNVIYKRKYEDFNHLDFLWAIDAPTLLYDDIIEVMEKF